MVIAKRLFRKWKQIAGSCDTEKSFPGIDLDNMLELKKTFQVSITVFQLKKNGSASIIWKSDIQYLKKMNLNLYQNHFSLVKDLKTFCKTFYCDSCHNFYANAANLKRHHCSSLEKRFRFPTGCYRAKTTIFDEIEDSTGVYISPERKFFPYRITFDIESYLERDNLPAASEKLSFIGRHRIMSVSVCSNVPDYEKAQCFISDGSDRELIRRFVDYLTLIQQKSFSLLGKEYKDVLQLLDLQAKKKKN
jgi:hypothetical protein